MRKKLIVLALIALMAVYVLPVFAQEAAWTYPLAANLLENKNGNLVLTNKDNLLDASFVPGNLTVLRLRAVSGLHELRNEAALALTDMFAAAEQDGFKLYVKSSYRSYQTQNTMYKNRLEKNGKDDGVVAYPGSSDHQTGLGVDVLNYDWAQRDGMTPEFGKTREAQWMEANCVRFGFIIRYLPEKQDVTGIIYEPWHLRYVGREVAQYIMDHRLSLEEFTTEYQVAIKEYESRGGDFLALCKEQNAPSAPKALDETDEEGDNEVSLFYEKP